MNICEHVIDVTPKQREVARQLESIARRVVRHLRSAFPYDINWRLLEKWWNGKVFIGPTENAATLDSSSGCLLVGIPRDGGSIEILTSRLLLALSRAASNGKACTTLHDTILREASKELKISFDVTCSDIVEHGLLESWAKNVPCHFSRTSWPEFIGLPLVTVVDAFQKSGRNVEAYTWDSMYGKPASSNTVRVMYDAKTGLVVSPAPHVGSVPIPTNDDQCFIKPDDSFSCIGAPLGYPPPEWSSFVGKYFTEVVDALRFQYPHATIEALPSTLGVSGNARRDRIVVRFNPLTARVSSVPMIG